MTSSAIYLTVNDDFEFNHSHSQSHSQSQLMQRTESKSINQNNYEEKVVRIGIHLAWMAHHKHMAAICPNIFNKNKRFDYNDDSYFESFHEIVTILKTIIDDNGDNGDNKVFPIHKEIANRFMSISQFLATIVAIFSPYSSDNIASIFGIQI